MAEITRFLGMSFGFCEDFDSAPHVHVSYNQNSCTIGLETFGVLTGSVPPRVALIAMEWVMLNKEQLKQSWDTLKSGDKTIPYFRPLVE